MLAAGLTFVAPAADAVTLPDPVADGTAWLTGRLNTDHLLTTQYGVDYFTSVDAAIALSVTGDSADANAIADAVKNNIDHYVSGTDYGYPNEVTAGAVAKAAFLAHLLGDDPTTFGHDLIAQLESVTDDTTGAIHDAVDPSDSFGGDYANTIGQAFAVRDLADASSPEALQATAWLLQQQCPGGGFSLNLGQASSQCTTSADADPDSTAYVLILLGSRASSDTQWARIVGRAEAYLTGHQNADGSFNGGSTTDAPNANSTGLAGWALDSIGDSDAAAAAATWVRAHQVQAVVGCGSALDPEVGAIGYDNLALTNGRVAGIGTNAAYQWQLATAQALPALADAPTGASSPTLTAPTAYVAAGSTATVHASGLNPGTWVCGSVGSSHVPGAAGLAGTAAVKVKVPAGTGNRTVTLSASDGTSATAVLKALAAKTLTVVVTKTTVAHGGSQTVKASGLAAAEPLKVSYNGKVIKTATASATGTYALTFPVGSTTGNRTVKVQGAFANRVGSKSFKVS